VVCTHECAYLCVYTCMYVCIYAKARFRARCRSCSYTQCYSCRSWRVRVYVRICASIHVCMYVCIQRQGLEQDVSLAYAHCTMTSVECKHLTGESRHTNTHTHIHTHIHTRTHAHAHTQYTHSHMVECKESMGEYRQCHGAPHTNLVCCVHVGNTGSDISNDLRPATRYFALVYAATKHTWCMCTATLCTTCVYATNSHTHCVCVCVSVCVCVLLLDATWTHPLVYTHTHKRHMRTNTHKHTQSHMQTQMYGVCVYCYFTQTNVLMYSYMC